MFFCANKVLLITLIVLSYDAYSVEINNHPKQSENHEIEEITKKVANPLAPITTVLFNSRVNFFEHGNEHKSNYLVRLLPSIFRPIDNKSAILTRLILPFTFDNFPDGSTGFGDVNVLPYYVPDVTKKNFLGFGLSINAPTASKKSLGTGKWSAGPSMLFARTSDTIVGGCLLSHLQSVGGDPSRYEVETSTAQPFVTLILNKGRTISVSSETNYSWNLPARERLVVPVTAGATQLIQVNKKATNFGLAVSYFFERNSINPKADVRFNVTYVFN